MSIYEPYIDDAQRIEQEYGIPASVTLAQLTLESRGASGGLSGLAKQANNFFGMKGEGTAGSINMPTSEWIGGKYVTVNQSFAKYASPYDSLKAYAENFQNERYAKYLKKATTVNEFVEGVYKGGYATDPKYVELVNGVIQSNNLTQYDGENWTFTGSGGSDPGPSTPDSFAGEVAFNSLRVFLLIGLFVVGMLLILRSFPVTKGVIDLAETVVSPKEKMDLIKKAVK